MATMTMTKENGTAVKSALRDILVSISWADLSRRYFGKSNSWLYHKLDGIDGNGRPSELSEEERERLREALTDLSDRIRAAAGGL